eukprot:9504093-Pyramimonas_sp.AAC.1
MHVDQVDSVEKNLQRRLEWARKQYDAKLEAQRAAFESRMANDNAVMLWEKRKELDAQFGEMTSEWANERNKLVAKQNRAIAAYALKEVPPFPLDPLWTPSRPPLDPL